MYHLGIEFLKSRVGARCCLLALIAVAPGLTCFLGAAHARAGKTSCWIFSPAQPACAGCVDVFNCGICSGGQCQSLVYQECAQTFPAIEVSSGGSERLTDTVPCWTRFDCGIPAGCTGPCTTSGNEASHSQASVLIQWQGPPC